MQHPKVIHRLVTVTTLWISLAAGASVADAKIPPEALETIRHIAIQHNGRNKPFDSFAWETVDRLTGSPKLGHEDPVVTILSILASPEPWQDRPLIAVPFHPVRDALGMDPKATHISLNAIVATRKLMRMLPALRDKLQRDEKLSMMEQETWDVFERFVLLNKLLQQELALVPPPGSASLVWLPILKPEGYPEPQQLAIRSAWTELLTALQADQAPTITVAAQHLSGVLAELQLGAYPARWRLQLEVAYNHLKPFQIARILYALACLALLLGLAPARRQAAAAGIGLMLAAFLVHGVGIMTRVVLGDRKSVV